MCSVDQLTGHAKGSLSESFLLRMAPNDKKIALQVHHNEHDGDNIVEVGFLTKRNFRPQNVCTTIQLFLFIFYFRQEIILLEPNFLKQIFFYTLESGDFVFLILF